MRGGDERSGSLFSYVDLEARVGQTIRCGRSAAIVNEALAALSGEFSALYSPMGRPSIPPEKLLRAMLLQAFYSIRSERQLMERLEFDLLFRWFVGIGVDDAVWDHSTFSKNRDRLLEGDIAAKLLSAVLAQPRVKRLLSTDHFSVDGTLIEAWASMKSFKPKDGGGRTAARRRRAQPGGGFPRAEALERDARLDHRSRSAALSQGAGQGSQALLHGACADGEPQRPGRRRLSDAGRRPCGADRGAAHDRAARRSAEARSRWAPTKPTTPRTSSTNCASMKVTPHVAQNTNGRSSAIDGRTTRHAGYAVSQRIRKRIEEAFGWIKTVAGQEKTKFRGRERVGWAFTFAAAAYNLARLPKLMAAPA